MKRHMTLSVQEHTMRGYEDPVSDDVVVFFHGFTGHMAESGRLFLHVAQSLAAAGYATLRFDWLGHGESDLAFVDLRVPLLQEQARIVLDYAQRNYRRVHLLGFSMGGALAMHAATDELASLILLAPAINMSDLTEEHFRDSDRTTQDLGGIVLHRAFAAGFRLLQPLDGAKRFNHPILLLQGKQDLAVPCKQTQELHAALPQSRLVIVPDADHCFHRRDQHDLLAREILDFLHT